MRPIAWVSIVLSGCQVLTPTKEDTTTASGAGAASASSAAVSGSVTLDTGYAYTDSADTGAPFTMPACATVGPTSPVQPCALEPDAVAISACAAGGHAALLGAVGFPTVDAAITAAGAGDTVQVCPGTWPGLVTIGVPITLTAADPTPGATVIDGNGVTGGLEVTATSTLRGLTVRDGHRPQGGGILVSAAGTVLECMTVEDNRARNGGGVNGTAPGLVVRTSTFSHNAANYAGGGLDASAGVYVEDTTFDGNVSGYEGGGASVRGDATFLRTAFESNAGDYDGGALRWGDWDPFVLTITDSVFHCNGAGYSGGGVEVGTWADDLAVITRATFDGNYADYEAGGLQLGSWGAIDVTVTDSTFAWNRAGRASGGAVEFGGWLQNGATGKFDGTTFTDNDASQGGAIATSSLGPWYAITAIDSTFHRNSGSAIAIDSTTTFIGTGCDMGAGADDNTPDDAQKAGASYPGLGANFAL